VPGQFGNYIHWVDRSKGVFKIVDSVKVASLWGKRKVSVAWSPKIRPYNMKKTDLSIFGRDFCERYLKNNLKPHLGYLDINTVLLQNVASHNVNLT
jgi:hypothetical protein